MKLKYLIALATLPLISACTMETMTTNQISELYSDTTSLSSNKATANYYYADGRYKSTDLETGEVTRGTWYAKEPDEICITSDKGERCFAMSKSDTMVTFELNGNKSSRKLSEYLEGDQTSELVKAAK
ncbi:hypothetical protein [Nereida ignava]|uniref:hypothetical protein n=1 Tax=Nereida ignava TaxID=282199 RepID=UPI003F6B5125